MAPVSPVWKGTGGVQMLGCDYPSLHLALSSTSSRKPAGEGHHVQGSQARTDTARRVNEAACPDSSPAEGPEPPPARPPTWWNRGEAFPLSPVQILDPGSP